MSVVAILMRDGGGYFVGLSIAVAAVLVLTGVVHGLDAWAEQRKAARADRDDDILDEV